MEDILTNHLLERFLVSRTCKGLNDKNADNAIEKWIKDLNQHFSKEINYLINRGKDAQHYLSVG